MSVTANEASEAGTGRWSTPFNCANTKLKKERKEVGMGASLCGQLSGVACVRTSPNAASAKSAKWQQMPAAVIELRPGKV